MSCPSSSTMSPSTTDDVVLRKITETSTSGIRRSAKRAKITHPTLGYAIPPPLPAKVARRNARERNRVKQVNCGFEYLRSHIPNAAKCKKMSKVDTLRHAVEYIQTLQRMLSEQRVVKEEVIPSVPSTPGSYVHDSGYETSPTMSSSSSTSSSSSVLPPSTTFVFPPHNQQHSEVFNNPYPYDEYYQLPLNPEEDELLDVIARWQES